MAGPSRRGGPRSFPHAYLNVFEMEEAAFFREYTASESGAPGTADTSLSEEWRTVSNLWIAQQTIKCLKDMEENPDVAVLSFYRTHGPNIRDGRFERFERRPQRAEYRFNCQIAIWRRERLIKFIHPKESPWDWEIIGSVRSGRYRDGFYTLIEGEKPVFSYYGIGCPIRCGGPETGCAVICFGCCLTCRRYG